jgi:hypothetical protein
MQNTVLKGILGQNPLGGSGLLGGFWAFASEVTQFSFVFTRPEIDKVVDQGVFPCRFGVFDVF